MVESINSGSIRTETPYTGSRTVISTATSETRAEGDCHPERAFFAQRRACPELAEDLGEPPEATCPELAEGSRSLRCNDRAFGSLPDPT